MASDRTLERVEEFMGRAGLGDVSFGCADLCDCERCKRAWTALLDAFERDTKLEVWNQVAANYCQCEELGGQCWIHYSIAALAAQPTPEEEDYSICGYRTERWIEGRDHSFVCKRRPGHSGQHYSNAQTGDELGLSGGGTSKADAKDGADTGSCRQQSVDSPTPPVAPGEQQKENLMPVHCAKCGISHLSTQSCPKPPGEQPPPVCTYGCVHGDSDPNCPVHGTPPAPPTQERASDILEHMKLFANSPAATLACRQRVKDYADRLEPALATAAKQAREGCADKLEKVAAQCEAGGHTSRGKMFRAIAAELRTK